MKSPVAASHGETFRAFWTGFRPSFWQQIFYPSPLQKTLRFETFERCCNKSVTYVPAEVNGETFTRFSLPGTGLPQKISRRASRQR